MSNNLIRFIKRFYYRLQYPFKYRKREVNVFYGVGWKLNKVILEWWERGNGSFKYCVQLDTKVYPL